MRDKRKNRGCKKMKNKTSVAKQSLQQANKSLNHDHPQLPRQKREVGPTAYPLGGIKPLSGEMAWGMSWQLFAGGVHHSPAAGKYLCSWSLQKTTWYSPGLSK